MTSQEELYGKMDDNFYLLNTKLYLSSYTNDEQWQKQQQLTVEENKGGSSTGHPIYISGLVIGRNPYGGKRKAAGLFKRLDQAKQSFKRKFDEYVEKTTRPSIYSSGNTTKRGSKPSFLKQ